MTLSFAGANRHFVAPLALAVLTGSLGCGGQKAHVVSSPHALVGQVAPEFRRDTIDGAVFKTSDHKGKVMVVKFAANYCEPCKKSLPALEAFHQKTPDVPIVIVDEDEHVAEARTLAAATRITMPVVLDGSNILSARFRVADLPSVYVIGKDQKVVWMGGPDRSHDDLVRAIDEARRAAMP